ncbi:MAG: 60S ribosomal export protein NMD3 [Thermoplasmata archaeon]|nr:60S ribosomal export protein NMD3 [Thermoplasmata archaeon]
MDDSEFCVVCGATGRVLVDGTCAECAIDRTRLVSAAPRVVVTICPTCGARPKGTRWEGAGSSSLLTSEDLTPHLRVHPEAGLRRVDWEEVSHTPTVREYEGQARVGFRGAERMIRVPLSVRIDHRTCPDCSRKSGRYFTATLQLRGPAEGPTEKSPALRARLETEWNRLYQEARPDWRRAVSWLEPLPEGWDCFFTDTLAARAMAKLAKQRFGASLKESATLFGRKDGRDIYRVTFCLRFPRPAKPPSPAVEP